MAMRRPTHQIEPHHEHEELRTTIRSDDPSTMYWLAGAIVFLLLIVAGFIGWAIGHDEQRALVVDEPGVPVTEPVGDLVTLSGEVDDFLSPSVFVLGAEGDAARVLVYARDIPEGVDIGSVIRVSGEARAIDTLLELDPRVDDTVLLVASQIELLSPQ